MRSLFFDKFRKVAKCSQKLLWVAVYLPNWHVHNGFGQGLETGKRLTPIVGFETPCFVDEFYALFDEISGNFADRFNDDSAWRKVKAVGYFPVVIHLRLPSVEETKEVGAAAHLVPSLGQEMGDSSASKTSAYAAAEEADDYRQRILWHIIAGVSGGILGGLAGALGYLAYIGEIEPLRCWRRSKSARLESPYPIGGNPPVFHMTYIV